MFGLKKKKNKSGKANSEFDITIGSHAPDSLPSTQETLPSGSSSLGSMDSFTQFEQEKNRSGATPSGKWYERINLLPIAAASAAMLAASAGSYAYHVKITEVKTQAINNIERLRAEALNQEKLALSIKKANFSDIERLRQSASAVDGVFDQIFRDLSQSSTMLMNPLPSDYATQMKSSKETWENEKHYINYLASQKQLLLRFREDLRFSQRFVDDIKTQAVALQKNTAITNPSAQKIAADLVFLSYRIESLVNDVALKEAFGLQSTYMLVKDVNTMRAHLDTIRSGSSVYGVNKTSNPQALEILNALEKGVGGLKEFISAFQVSPGLINDTKQFAVFIEQEADKLIETYAAVAQQIPLKGDRYDFLRYASFALFALAAIGALLIAYITYSRSKSLAKLAEVLGKNQSNENALVDLLVKIQPMDYGDFTNEITVEDKFLLNVANRVNELRVLFGNIVKQMRGGSESIMSAATSTRDEAQQMLQLSDEQQKLLEATIQKINEVTGEIDSIAQATWVAQEESARSSESAQNGEKIVLQSIAKMNDIRNTIQESSKKIKKLGESAQSITEVTSLINDITKQINVLALNAAIQAASSGDSGREFSIVAQEVRRLADDSAVATKRIEEIIDNIQSDAAIAIASMEKTTQEVVVGSNMTESAGELLKEISAISDTVAKQVSESSSQLEQNSAKIAEVTLEIGTLEKIYQSVKNAATKTSEQVNSLEKISNEFEKTFNQYRV